MVMSCESSIFSLRAFPVPSAVGPLTSPVLCGRSSIVPSLIFCNPLWRAPIQFNNANEAQNSRDWISSRLVRIVVFPVASQIAGFGLGIDGKTAATARADDPSIKINQMCVACTYSTLNLMW
jgi:hypothetical protein